ncbi:uncharacterized protein LOC110172183 isoform X2 [Boleophthalmus pectinirostris]|uniref:uncharacterized protein LOC110172183 isoform X2 n=1 Tax=Boleophthalmus pectinirostris TaxID=150288 RepID=UPI000A1C6B77|nr:uncharacterized protein LOC110172183 isoform X2 [Boleophthalmus pectinirostris]XP_055013283.1 uncharacterized protein LOC110172183 isoform X2 [Boleophthalmus pectinirostris]
MEEVETKVELWSVSVVGQNSEFGSIKDEKADSNEKDKSGSHCISGSAQVQLEGDGRHHEAVCCNCKWLHQMEPAKFNSLLKCIFVFLIASQLSIFLTLRYPEIFRELFFVTNFIFGAIGLYFYFLSTQRNRGPPADY